MVSLLPHICVTRPQRVLNIGAVLMNDEKCNYIFWSPCNCYITWKRSSFTRIKHPIIIFLRFSHKNTFNEIIALLPRCVSFESMGVRSMTIGDNMAQAWWSQLRVKNDPRVHSTSSLKQCRLSMILIELFLGSLFKLSIANAWTHGKC